MLRLPGSLPIGGRLTVEPGPEPVPPPLELPHPASRAAPPRDAAPARKVRRSSLFVIDPPIRTSGVGLVERANVAIMTAGVQMAAIHSRRTPRFGLLLAALVSALSAVAAGCGSGAAGGSSAIAPLPVLPASALAGLTPADSQLSAVDLTHDAPIPGFADRLSPSDSGAGPLSASPGPPPGTGRQAPGKRCDRRRSRPRRRR